MKIVFMGTPDFAAVILKRLADEGYEIAAVFTQPDKPVGRKKILTPPPVKVLAESLGIPVYQPKKLKNGEVAAQIRSIAPQLAVVAAYGRILPKDILEAPEYGCINIHASLLPKYRGAAPIQWSIVNGDKETGVTTMKMAEGLDTGDMILTLKTEIRPDETLETLFDRLAQLGAEAAVKTIEKYADGTVTFTPQNEAEATYAPIIDRDMGRFKFGEITAKEADCLIRGLCGWPCASFEADGKRIKIYSAKIAENTSGEAGTLLDSKKLIIACREGALELLEIQPEGKARMSGEAYLRGARLVKNTKFTN